MIVRLSTRAPGRAPLVQGGTPSTGRAFIGGAKKFGAVDLNAAGPAGVLPDEDVAGAPVQWGGAR